MNSKPDLETRHRRIHVVHEGVPFVVCTRDRLGPSYMNGMHRWHTEQHVIETPSGSLYAGAQLQIDPSKRAIAVEITREEFEGVLARAVQSSPSASTESPSQVP